MMNFFDDLWDRALAPVRYVARARSYPLKYQRIFDLFDQFRPSVRRDARSL